MSDIEKKIAETEAAIAKTNSWKCRNDLTKYLKRLKRELRRGNYEAS